MDIDLYQEFTKTINVKPTESHITNGLFAEAGEVAGVYQKYHRGDYDEAELIRRLKKELGGLMWYISELCNYEGLNLSEILTMNRDELIDRQNRGVLQGDGDTLEERLANANK